ncbi:hypothetical protein P4T04_05125 [Bacillus badius]|uniref:hypothetical protein n=1 Tax=Bacillus badius TaxID=1455 RepID=UPI002E1F28F6|nr:hypothetical protein [Bacillus badius]
MPHVKTMFTEETLQTDFIELAVANGWTLVKRFKKASFRFGDIYYSGVGTVLDPASTTIRLKLADHALIKNSTNDIYGIARICEPKLTWGEIPAEFKTGQYPNREALTDDSNLREQFHEWLLTKWDENNVDTSKIYFYMLKSAPDIPEDFEVVYPTLDNLGVRDVLDIELLSYTPIKKSANETYEFSPSNAQHLIMQSPMVPVSTRNIGTADNGWLTNWWPDSKIKVEGFIDDETVVLLIRADSTAAYNENQVPLIPIYFGSLIPLNSNDTGHASLFAGSATPNGNYKYDSSTPFISGSSILMPLQKKYPQNPGNGIDNIIVKRGLQGAYYQAYYLSAHTGPEKMPPNRQDNTGRQFPSAWKNAGNDEYNYPPISSYSNKAAVSRAMVMHPEERQRGYLKNIVLAESVGPRNNTRLKVKKAACPNVFEFYKYFVVDAVSPITKRPAVAYRPMAIGIFEKEE